MTGFLKESFLQTGWACGGSSEGDSAPSEARKRGSGGGSPRKHDDNFSDDTLRQTFFNPGLARSFLAFRVNFNGFKGRPEMNIDCGNQDYKVYSGGVGDGGSYHIMQLGDGVCSSNILYLCYGSSECDARRESG